MSARRSGLPVVVKMRHDAHYVEEMISRSGAAIGRMIPIEQILANAEQPRKDQGDLHGLTESVREKGVLEPLLVRHLAEMTGRGGMVTAPVWQASKRWPVVCRRPVNGGRSCAGEQWQGDGSCDHLSWYQRIRADRP